MTTLRALFDVVDVPPIKYGFIDNCKDSAVFDH